MRSVAFAAFWGVVLLVVGCAGPRGAVPAASITAADSADHVYWGVQHTMTHNGVKQGNLDADTSFVFEDFNRFELRGNVRLMLFDSLGAPVATLTAREATYSIRGQNMVARGDVVVTTTDGNRLDSQHLVFDQRDGSIRSDSAFVIVKPDGRIEGPSFISDPKLEELTCAQCVFTSVSGGAPTQQPPARGRGADTLVLPDTSASAEQWLQQGC